MFQILSIDKPLTELKQERIIVSEKEDDSNHSSHCMYNSVYVRSKSKDRKQEILKRLMLFGLKPSLRMAALKMLVCKQKQVSLSDEEIEDEEGKAYFFDMF